MRVKLCLNRVVYGFWRVARGTFQVCSIGLIQIALVCGEENVKVKHTDVKWNRMWPSMLIYVEFHIRSNLKIWSALIRSSKDGVAMCYKKLNWWAKNFRRRHTLVLKAKLESHYYKKLFTWSQRRSDSCPMWKVCKLCSCIENKLQEKFFRVT